jgi:hypothetical protein
MRARPVVLASVVALTVIASGALFGFGQTPAGSGQAPLPLEPLGNRGEAVFPALEGWYPNPDGSITILLGYFNRNSEQTLEIPIGPNNRIEPGGPDRGQPTVFLPRRGYGVFTITVPKEQATNRITWTIVANGQTSTLSLWANPPYLVEPFKNLANGNTPPVIRFSDGKDLTGPPRGIAQTLKAKVGEALPLSLDVVDQAPTYTPPPNPAAAARGRGRGGPPPLVVVIWTKYRGPGEVKFSEGRNEFKTLTGTAATTASFTEPGEYMVRATINDSSGDGGGGDQCCWTTALIKVTVDK